MPEEHSSWWKLTANQNKNNIVEGEQLRATILNVTTNIVSMLKSHCGPNAQFAMVVNPGTPDPPKHTTDGIGIVRDWETFNPIEKFIRKDIMHVGGMVERRIGDGTTTAMITAATVLNHMMFGRVNGTADIEEVDYTYFNYEDLRSLYKKIVAMVLEAHDKYITRVEDYPETTKDGHDAVWQLAYAQAMTSSHGDKDLSELVAKIFSATPKQAWSSISFVRKPVESEERLSLVINDAQFTCDARPMDSRILNKMAGTVYEMEHVHVFAPEGILAVGDPAHMEILEKAISIAKSGANVLIICPGPVDTITASELSKILDPNFAVMHVSVKGGNKYNDLFGLRAVCGHNLQYHSSIVNRVVLKNKRLAFYGIAGVEGVVEDSRLSLELTTEERENDLFSTSLYELELIEQQMENDPFPSVETLDQLKQLRDLIQRIRYNKRYEIHIGGTSRDHLHAYDVITDTLTATKNSLLHGCVPASNVALFVTIATLIGSEFNDITLKKEENRFARLILQSILSALEIIFRCSCFKYYNTGGNRPNEDFYRHFSTESKLEEWKSDRKPLPQKSIKNHILYRSLNFETPMAVQPANLSEVMLKQIGDCLLKYPLTSRLIAIGCIND